MSEHELAEDPGNDDQWDRRPGVASRPGTDVQHHVADDRARPSPRRSCRPHDAIDELSHLVTAAAPVTEVAQLVTSLALVAVAADGCALTVHRAIDDHVSASADGRSDDVAGRTAHLEAELGEGPATTARRTRRPEGSPDVRDEERWPAWGRRATALGVLSTLTVVTGAQAVDETLTWVSDSSSHFGPAHRSAAVRFAAAAGPALRNARIGAELRSQQGDLERALRSRTTIDQAVGILMARHGGTPAEAWVRLRVLGRRDHATIPDLARGLVEEAARRSGGRTG